VQQAAPLSGRRWAWLWIAGIVFFSFGFAKSLLDGHDTAAVWAAISVLVGVWLLVRSLRPQPSPSSSLRWYRLRSALLLDLFFLTTATIATVRATRSSGGEQVLWILAAVALLLVLAMGVVQTVTVSARVPDPRNAERNGSDEAP